MSRSVDMAKLEPLHLRDMRPGIRYVVSRGAGRGTLRAGDRVRWDANHGICSREHGSWMGNGDKCTLSDAVRVRVDASYYPDERALMEAVRVAYAPLEPAA